ncbi:MAG: hypothetical protein Q4F95_15870 [Oscillospiraceae bacterium]|nr:hypothetical protein [Oscillospiraceae bacterium]
MLGNDYIMGEIRRLTEAIAKKVFNVESDDAEVFNEKDGARIGAMIKKDLNSEFDVEFDFGSGVGHSE